MRIGFLFNHDQIHQVAHSLPIALAMAERGYPGDLIVATTTPALAQEVRRLGGAHIGTTIQHVELAPSALSRSMDAVLGKVVPAAKLLIYRDNLGFFRSLDVLVVAEKTSLILRKRYGLTNLAFIHTRHGAGDRAIGFDKASAGFDHVLCSGGKIRDRLVAEAGLDPARISVVGYPKFDVVRDREPKRFLPAAEKVVLYNPHCSPHLSSWYRHGHDVFEHFLGDQKVGLLFAPHVMLFQRDLVFTIDRLRIDKPGAIPPRFLRGENIKIDLGSRASTDMSYTLAADIYLGDASSQIYEFLLRPRPCIFLNSHGHAWRNDPNFLHWNAGEVIGSPDELPAAIERAGALHARHYRQVQEDLFARSFDLTTTPSSVRAAEAIAAFVERRSGMVTTRTLAAA
ncbi:hypothetical protein WBP06_19030 [Novosphingobium sp. BL-8H]|uniref:hypothetical protein n=1 Tax=Novosphingobium sp. BL-8H TaxID=3127640 RepID=UPI0037572443